MDWKFILTNSKAQLPISMLLLVTGIIGTEKLFETDFICPCSEKDRKHIFWLYLVIPAISVFTITFYLATRSHGTQKTEKTPRTQIRSHQEDTEETMRTPAVQEESLMRIQSQHSAHIYAYLAIKSGISLFASLIWVVLFLGDGRYLDCLKHNVTVHYVTVHVNDCQKKDTNYYKILSKIIGLYLLLVLSVLPLLVKLCHSHIHSYCQHGSKCSCCLKWCRLSKMCCDKCNEECCDECCEEFYSDKDALNQVTEQQVHQIQETNILLQDISVNPE